MMMMIWWWWTALTQSQVNCRRQQSPGGSTACWKLSVVSNELTMMSVCACWFIIPARQTHCVWEGQVENDQRGESLAACFIETTLANVPHPLDHVVVAVVQLRLKHLQIAYFETRRSKRHLYHAHTVTSSLYVTPVQGWVTIFGWAKHVAM